LESYNRTSKLDEKKESDDSDYSGDENEIMNNNLKEDKNNKRSVEKGQSLGKDIR